MHVYVFVCVCVCVVMTDDNRLLSLAAFEVNFMDDVGQTLLNWASAFGTQEMVKKVKSHKVLEPFA